MKKLALLLGALSLVSSVAYAKEVVPAVEEVVVVEEVKPVEAAPALRVTSIGQYIEIDNTSGQQSLTTKGADIGEDVHFGNYVNLAYGDDWTFGLMARKTWSMDTDDGIHSKNHRIDLDAWRNYEHFSVGTRWRSESDMDRLYGRVKYNYGMFDGWVDVAYQFNNTKDSDDLWYSEGEPIALTYGPVRFAYYYETYYSVGNVPAGEEEYDIAHQLRVSAPIYQGEKLSLGLEYRWQFAYDEEYKDHAPIDGWQECGKHIGILSAAYKVTENLTVDGYYRYDFQSYEGKDGASDNHDDYYGEFYAGWTYRF